jgi:stage II sporulation protein D
VTIGGPAQALVGLAARSTDGQVLATPITITMSGRVWRVEDAKGAFKAFTAIGDSERAAGLRIEGMGPTPLTVGKAPYPGKLLLVPSKERGPAAQPATPGDGQASARAGSPGSTPAAVAAPPSPTQFDVLELIAIESYLPGVVAKELPAGWELNTFKAQAIIARSYALHERDRAARTDRNYDIEAGESDQVYAGVSGDQRVQQAVRETRGEVLMTQGHVLRAYYSSTCGGRASSAKDVWPTTAGFEFNLDGPLQGHAPEEFCSPSPLYRWTVTRQRDDLTRRLTAYGRDNGLGVRNLKSFTGASPSAFNAEGRPTQYKVFDSDGTWWPLSAEQLRTACNWTGSSGRPAVTRQERVNSGDATFTLQGAKVIIAGRGFGHGVGLCQFGAQGMAKTGWSVDAILKFYYPGATIERLY